MGGVCRLFLLQLLVLRSAVAVGASDSVLSVLYALGLALELLLKEASCSSPSWKPLLQLEAC